MQCGEKLEKRDPGMASPPRVGRPDLAALAAAVLGPLALYVATLPRTVVLEDDSLFLMAGVHLGVAHPPGYPLYTLIVHLFTRLPFGDVVFLGHLSSAVLGALACGAVYACARLLRASPAPALIVAWLFGVSEQFWSQAIIAEVYTLNALLFFATYALVLHGAQNPRRGWPLAAADVAWGAGLANHWPLMVLATPGLAMALALAPKWRDVLGRLPRLLGAAFLTAALPYAWMVWLSHQSAISFYGPHRHLGRTLVLRQPGGRATAASTSAPAPGGATVGHSWGGSRPTSCGRRPCPASRSPCSASGRWLAAAFSPEPRRRALVSSPCSATASC